MVDKNLDDAYWKAKLESDGVSNEDLETKIADATRVHQQAELHLRALFDEIERRLGADAANRLRAEWVAANVDANERLRNLRERASHMLTQPKQSM